MPRDLLRFFTYFTTIDRIKSCIKDKTRKVLLGRRYPCINNEYTVVGKLYISEHNAYVVLSSWHISGFKKLIEPYVYCTKILTYPRADMDDELNTVYHITGIRNTDYISDFK